MSLDVSVRVAIEVDPGHKATLVKLAPQDVQALKDARGVSVTRVHAELLAGQAGQAIVGCRVSKAP